MSSKHKYAAFISYAHTDERAAQRLHVALESYNLPKDILVNGHKARTRLSPIFRDVTELTAAHSLSDKIREALAQSAFLIVLCSPDAKASHWVNEEIRLFRQLHGEQNILSAIVAGTPSSAFPEALLEKGHEPLAANLKTGRDGFRFGVHQIAASILGVGLDRLVQRAEKRRRLKTQIISAASTTLALIMGGLTFMAVQSRDEARQSRDDAEALIEYMITDLKVGLDSVQRLDILDNLGEQILEYYQGTTPSNASDDMLGRQIQALQMLSEVSLDQGSFDKSFAYLDVADPLIKELEKRSPDDPDTWFLRAQSAFWRGYRYNRQFKFEKALPYYQHYDDIGQRLYQYDPTNPRWIMEAAWGSNNLGAVHRHMENYDTSKNKYLKGEQYFLEIIALQPDNLLAKYEYSNLLFGLGLVYKGLDNKDKAIYYYQKQIQIHKDHLQQNNNNEWEYQLIQVEDQLLHLQDEIICNNPKFNRLITRIKTLLDIDPNHRLWHREYVLQTSYRIQNCLDINPQALSPHEIPELLEMASLYTDDKYIPDIVKNIKISAGLE